MALPRIEISDNDPAHLQCAHTHTHTQNGTGLLFPTAKQLF